MKCKAKKTDGSPCKAWAIKGAEVCRVHGGRAPQVRAAAARNLAEAALTSALTKRLRDATPVNDPLGELRRLAGEAVLWKDKLSEKVDELSSYEYTAAFGDEKVKATVAIFTSAMRSCHELLRDMARLNIDERQLKIDEATAMAVIRAIDKGLKLGGVTGPVALAVREAVARELRAGDLELTA